MKQNSLAIPSRKLPRKLLDELKEVHEDCLDEPDQAVVQQLEDCIRDFNKYNGTQYAVESSIFNFLSE